MSEQTGVLNEKAIVIERTFDAPVERVWQAWTDAEAFKKWWGLSKYTCPYAKIDFREGGKYHAAMRSEKGQDMYSTGTYKEIEPVKRIVMTDSFADEKGNVISGSEFGMENFPLELLVKLNFSEENGKTRFTLEHIGMHQGEMSDMTRAGWNESFDKLEKSLKD